MWSSAPLIGRTASVVAGMLSAVAFGFTVRALLDHDQAGRHALKAGVMLAFGVWVGTEVQVTAGLCLGVVALKWVVDGGKWLAINRRMALGLALGLASALAVERGAGVLDVQYDRLSIVHVSLSVLILGFWSVVALLGERLRGAASRLAAEACADVVIIAVMMALFPKVLLSPLHDVDPVLLGVFASVAEYAPVSDPWRFLIYAGAVVFALPWAVLRAAQEQGSERWGWLLLAAGLAAYTVFRLNWIRWSMYIGLFSSMALAHLIVRADGTLDGLGPAVRTVSKVAVLLAFAVGPFTVGMAGVVGTSQAPAKTTAIAEPVDGDARPCPVRAMSGFLNAAPWGDKPHMILSSANDGAELLYRTPHRVMGTLHHPNARGILDSIRIFAGAGDDETLALVRQRRVDLVLVCRRWGGGAYKAAGGGRSLHQRLKEGDAPNWLTEVVLPQALGRAFRLYKVGS